MAQLQPLHLVHRSLIRKGCAHSIPPSLRARLVTSSTCPLCQITRLIKDIRDVQEGLTNRGGIFVSKEKVREEIEKGGNVKGVQAKRHRIWIKKWRATKIKIARLLVEFEQVLGKMKEAGEDAGVEEIHGALKMWKEVEDEMCVVPGYRFDDREYKVENAEEDELRNQIGSQPSLPAANSFNSTHVHIPCRLTVAFTDFTTYIPLTQPPTPSHTDHFKLRKLQLHNPYTTAETNRGRLKIQRSCSLYTPGTWASPKGCEKADTSLMNEDWEDVERMWGIETRTQDMETQEGLHIRSWMWVFKWWAKEVRKRGLVCKGVGKEKAGMRMEDVRGRIEHAGIWL